MRVSTFTILLLFCFSFLTKFSTTTNTNTLTTSQILRTNQTLLSHNKIFVLGFFPRIQTNSYYLGIWYNYDNTSVVWVANRDNPLQNNRGFLKIQNNGNLLLLNSLNSSSNQTPIWSSNQTTTTLLTKPVLQLLDTGNLVLKEPNTSVENDYLWQSFDYPTDTLLPGMKMGWNKYLTSWKTTGKDPSTGDLSFKIDYGHGLRQIFIRNGKNLVIYRCGPWNGERFSGVPRMEPNIDFDFTSDQEALDYSFIGSSSIYSRLIVSSEGSSQLQRLQWVPSSKNWTKLWNAPKDECDNYNECGPYGICNSNASPVCECVRGFSPKTGSHDCVRNNKLNCVTDRFWPIKNVKLPETTSVFVNKTMSIDECRDLCHRNCSCTAFANIYVTNGGVGCVMWVGELYDIRNYPDGGQDLYVRIAASDLRVNDAKKRVAVIIIPTVIVGASFVAIWISLSCISKRSGQTHLENRSAGGPIGGVKRVKIEDLPLFDFENISSATNNFGLANKIGQGGFGSVYKGVLPDGQEIAVKRLSKTSRQGVEEFMNEVIVISKLQHRNLVRLLGCCIEGDQEKMLVYEYLPNNSLDFYLFG